MHPDDLELISASMDKLMNGKIPVHGGMMRLKAKNGEYQWHLGSMGVMEKKDGRPWRVIACVQNLEQFMDTRNQILQLMRENLPAEKPVEAEIIG